MIFLKPSIYELYFMKIDKDMFKQYIRNIRSQGEEKEVEKRVEKEKEKQFNGDSSNNISSNL